MESIYPPLKILILDDNPVDRETCSRLLTQGAPTGTYEFFTHESLEGAMEKVQTEKPNCLLLEYHLRDGTGLDLLRQLYGATEEPQNAAVVVLSGKGNETIAVEVIKGGAQNYLRKDGLTADGLHGAVKNAIGAHKAACLLKNQQRRLKTMLDECEKAHLRKDRLLNSLSHDLRTSMTPVLIAASLLQEELDNPETVRKLAALIEKNAQAHNSIIDNLVGPVLPRPYG